MRAALDGNRAGADDADIDAAAGIAARVRRDVVEHALDLLRRIPAQQPVARRVDHRRRVALRAVDDVVRADDRDALGHRRRHARGDVDFAAVPVPGELGRKGLLELGLRTGDVDHKARRPAGDHEPLALEIVDRLLVVGRRRVVPVGDLVGRHELQRRPRRRAVERLRVGEQPFGIPQADDHVEAEPRERRGLDVLRVADENRVVAEAVGARERVRRRGRERGGGGVAAAAAGEGAGEDGACRREPQRRGSDHRSTLPLRCPRAFSCLQNAAWRCSRLRSS